MANQLIHLHYRRQDGSSSEQATITKLDSGYHLEGTIEAEMQAKHLTSHYQIQTNLGWETQNIQLEVKVGAEEHTLRLCVDDLQSWWDGDEEIGVLSGCQDVDLQISPLTNSLAINREGMPVGESRLVSAAWIRFPDLALQPLRQRYTRTGERTYLYEALESDFTAQIQVDDLGLVVRYGELWERV